MYGSCQNLNWKEEKTYFLRLNQTESLFERLGLFNTDFSRSFLNSQLAAAESLANLLPPVSLSLYLLIDDVEREDAHGVVGLDRAGGTVLVEGALCDPRKHLQDRGVS